MKIKSYSKNTMMFGMESKSSVKYDYEKHYMKIKFNSEDDLPLNKPLKFHSMTNY